MHKGNPEILRFEVALQDFAEFTIVIDNEQMRPELLRPLTGKFRCVRAMCALIVHDYSDESLLNHGSPAQTNRNEKSFARPYYAVLLSTIRCNLGRAGHPQSVARLDHLSIPYPAQAMLRLVWMLRNPPSRKDLLKVYFFGQRSPLGLKLSS